MVKREYATVVRELAEELGPDVGQIRTSDVAAICGVSVAVAWKAMHDLEHAGAVEGYARDRHGDDVERDPATGRPVRPAEIYWSLTGGESVTNATRVAEQIVDRFR
jgi:predicted ArsR family transcriptional regulator